MIVIKNRLLLGVMLLTLSCCVKAKSSLQQLFDDKSYPTFFIEAESKAKQQDKEALFLLGKAYHLGLGTDQDIAKALVFYQEASKLGEPRADNNMGIIYEQSNNLRLAVKYYQKAYDNGLETPSLSNLARTCLALMSTQDRGQRYVDYTESDALCVNYNTILYSKESSKNNLFTLSQAALYAFLYNPTSDEQVRGNVVKWLDMAIAEGSVEAITNKGIYYQQIWDEDKAKILFQDAADKGQVLAIYKMGEIVGNNNIEGILWYSKAASKGSSSAANEIKYFINRYNDREFKKVSHQQLTTIINDLEQYITYANTNKFDPISHLAFKNYDINNSMEAQRKLKLLASSAQLLEQYLSARQKNKPTYTANNIITMTRQLKSGGYIDADVAWTITTFSGDEILAKGVSSADGVVDLRLTQPDNQKIIAYLNQGGTLRFGYKQFVWFLSDELKDNAIQLTINIQLAKLVNQSKGKSPEAYIYSWD